MQAEAPMAEAAHVHSCKSEGKLITLKRELMLLSLHMVENREMKGSEGVVSTEPGKLI